VSRTLTIEEAKAFYDCFGAWQDWQAFYEDRAIEVILAHGDFPRAHAIVEFGCGTGRFAERLFRDFLASDARYLGIDVSSTMVSLAQRRLEPFSKRAVVRLSDGRPAIDSGDGSFDRFVSNYVFDLLASGVIRETLREAQRVLRPEGRLCLASLTRGNSPVTRFVSLIWDSVHSMSPTLVGGCRPVELLEFLDTSRWRIEHREVIAAFGICSEVLVAARP
jgi:ubiquinone/menaquinone biosynthesis C-methylase UbiE